jgi:uncharacterized protein (TIGR02266 family)
MPDKKNVLIICRAAAGQMYLGVLLSRIWYTPDLAKTAEEGIRLAQKKNYSLVVFAGDMGDQERRVAISLLRSHAAVKDLPLVAFITNENAGSTEALFAMGCSAVVTKPLDLSMFYVLLAQLSGQPRSTLRVPIKIRVHIEEGTPEKELTCTNLSEGGLYLRTHLPLPEKTVLHLSFSLPHSTDIITIAGEVIHTAPLGTQIEAEPGMGLRFVDLADTIQKQLRNFVQREMIGDLEWEAKI